MNLRPIFILLRATIKQQSKSKFALLARLAVPQAYTIVFITQIIINYQINPHAFANLPIESYFICLFVGQIIIFTSYDRSARYVAKSILNGELDLMLLRPINLFYFKYFRQIDIDIIIMTIFYTIALCIAFLFTHFPLQMLINIFLIVFAGTLIKLNIRVALRGMVFFYRDFLKSTRVEEALDGLTINKPPEIFPVIIATILTFIIPYLLFNNYVFDIVRNIQPSWFWAILFGWVILSILINNFIWRSGLKRYESIG